VNELASVVRKPPASMSQHLAKMRLARLVSTRRKGTKVFYRLDNSHVRQLVEDAVSTPSTPAPTFRPTTGSTATSPS